MRDRRHKPEELRENYPPSMSPSNLEDTYGRNFSYLRLSVTERCNFRCVYCLPDGYNARKSPRENELSPAEIRRLAEGLSEVGLSKVRLTGGEPTLRQDLPEIISELSAISSVRKVAISTNGHRLKALARTYHAAGASAVNVSLDSLDPNSFQAITGSSRISSVLDGIEEALAVGFYSVKVNCVLLRGLNEGCLESFQSWVRDKPVSVRFIELMRTGGIRDLFEERHIGINFVHRRLIESGWRPQPRTSVVFT